MQTEDLPPPLPNPKVSTINFPKMVPKVLENQRFWGDFIGTLGLGRGRGRSSVWEKEASR
eukprot:4256059-Amphidinium_carterae.1